MPIALLGTLPHILRHLPSLPAKPNRADMGSLSSEVVCYERWFKAVHRRYVVKEEERKRKKEKEGKKDFQGKSLNHSEAIFIRIALRCQSQHSLPVQEGGVPLPLSLPFFCSMRESYILQDPSGCLGYTIITCIFLHATKVTSLQDRKELRASVVCEMKPVPLVFHPW